MNELDFSGKQVLVVGGSSGIGNGIAQAFRARGAQVAVCVPAVGNRFSAEQRFGDFAVGGTGLRSVQCLQGTHVLQRRSVGPSRGDGGQWHEFQQRPATGGLLGDGTETGVQRRQDHAAGDQQARR